MPEPHIVVLDGYTANPGDLNWDPLEALGTCRIYDRTPPDDVIPRLQDAELALTNKVVLDRSVIAAAPRLRYIGVLATGYNIVDVEAAHAQGITVTNIPAYSVASVAQLTLALLLELTHHVGHHNETVHDGRWTASADWSYWDKPLVELQDLTMGVIGYGAIGSAVARLAHAFGMRVLVHTRTPPEDPPGWLTPVDLDDLFRKSDVVSIHCPLTPATEGLVNADRLSLMKRSAFLLNTSRGPIIDEPALADALADGRIAGTGLDVLSTEPPSADNPLLTAPNCIITPHIGWATQASRSRLLNTAFENVRAFLEGRPQNVITR